MSWYTALENGEADGVSESTLSAVADVLRLSESERQYLMALAGHVTTDQSPESSMPLAVQTMNAIEFPAYIITSDWIIVDCNETFRRIWGIGKGEVPFNAIDRMFLDARSRQMHGSHFMGNLTPVIAMLHSSLGRRPTDSLRALLERLLADPEIRAIWDDYKIASPLLTSKVTIESTIGTYHYETLTLPIQGVSGASNAIVVQVPDEPSHRRIGVER